MKAMLFTAALIGLAAAAPAWAAEGAGSPFTPAPTGTPEQMTMKQGGAGDPFSWSSRPTASTYAEKTGGAGDPFSWSASPTPPAPVQHAATPAQTAPQG